MSEFINKSELLKELLTKQLSNVPPNMRLYYGDLKRICKYISNSIFDENKCCIWEGYITNSNINDKGTYINFYYKKKKVALHRLLYSNFIQPMDKTEYLKFSCPNKGKCCNVYHYNKFKYNSQKKEKEKEKENKNENENKNTKHNKISILNKKGLDKKYIDELYISFD